MESRMLVTQQKILRRFWYPIAPSDRLTDTPFPFTLLGANIVLFRDAAGHASALIDRCCHRTAQLSQGWLDAGNIVCPYHGWTYAADGKCVRIPQRPNGDPGKGIAVEAFRCTERYGIVWVALEEPLAPIPDWPEETDPGYRRIDEFYEPWSCAGLRLMENSFDNAHIHFVHRSTFGDINNPDPTEPVIERLDYGFVARSDVPVFNNEEQKKNLRDDEAFTVRHITAHWYMPFLRRLHIRYPSGLDHIIVTAATPVSDGQSQIVQFCFRNDREEEAPAGGIIAFDRRVTAEDRAVLEGTDFDVPLDIHSGIERHMPSDQPGLLMRRMLLDLFAAHGETEQTRHVPRRRAAE
jgi:phenylpropionate dioxygenase-like ring-hydroxylating dioxygenase large terminal subunit